MKTTFKYDHYFKYEEMKNNLEALQNQYPNLMQLEVNCVTPEGRNQYAAALTNQKTGTSLSKPALYIDGNIHAGEVTAAEAAMYTLDYLLTNYESDSKCKEVLDHYTLYIIPRVSPDGAEKYLSTPYTLRSAPREYMYKKGGIKKEDLDNDGVIRMMRIPTPYGAWKKDPEDADLMVFRQPCDTEGEFYDIYPEGILNETENDNNLKCEKDVWGLDFNRNFPLGWFPEARQEGAGKYPLSNPETKALVDFVLAHNNIGGAAIGHTSGGLFLYPPGTMASAKAFPSDMNVMKSISAMGEKLLSYKPMNIFDSFMSNQEHFDSGALDDWFYQSQGIPAYTVEFWDVCTKAGAAYEWGQKETDKQKDLKRFNAVLAWVKTNAPEYYVPWHTISHPSFGKVEIGGFNSKFTMQNPPEKFLQHECEQDALFNISFILSLPKLVMDSVTSDRISDHMYKVTAVLGNHGYMSTRLTDEAAALKTAKPIIVSISTDSVISGSKNTEIQNLEGFSQTDTGCFYGNLTTLQSAKAKAAVTWIIKGDPGDIVMVKASNEKSGSVEAAVTL
jgi:hypothetical protein